jgi:aspartyl protease family protein
VEEIKPERISYPERERFFPWALFFSFCIGIVIVGFVGYLGYSQIHQNDERSFNRLKISVGDFDDRQILKLTPILAEYTADYCDPRSKLELLRKINAAGFVRLAAQLANDHYEKCAKNPEFLEVGYYYNDKLGEYAKAIEIINRLIELDPANANYRFSRAKTYEAMKLFERALLDDISALDLLGRPEKLDVQQFYEIATMYAQLGRFCEAATPLEAYISYDFVKRSSNPQIARLISEYRSKGNCKQSTKNNNASVPYRNYSGVKLVEATLNNVTGIFVLDTGAGLVTVTKSFANKAKIFAKIDDKVTLHTANGITDGLLATANSIQVGNAYSTFVPVVVQDDEKLGTADNVVGLLGNSFLYRFTVTVDKDSVELRSKF